MYRRRQTAPEVELSACFANNDGFWERRGHMTEEKMRKAVEKFAEEIKKIYGTKLIEAILYGSCARGDFSPDSDIDVMILLNVSMDEINEERKRIYDTSDKLDLEYDVVFAPVFQNYQVYQECMAVSVFYQNIQKEGIKIV